MKFVVEIECDNAAFDPKVGGDARQECARILRNLVAELYAGAPMSPLKDCCGNRVGRAQFHEENA